MASILDRYGIKEVADVTFYKINDDGTAGEPVLYLDTLKVSTIEQTAETADARGGKGNPKLITWDYGKEITVTIEDALFSPKSMAIMLGNGKASTKTADTVTRTITAIVRAADAESKSSYGQAKHIDYITADIYDTATKGATRSKIDMLFEGENVRAGMVAFASSGISINKLTKEDGTLIEDTTTSTPWTLAELQTAIANLDAGTRVFLTYSINVYKSEIVVSGDTFPGTYYITGDTYARSDATGEDQFFQFIIPKAKMTAENTITLEADGDPSTFSMNLTVLRPEDGDMMKLVQYDLKA